jgi:hypothetical protein
MKTLSALVSRDSYEVPAFAPDPFQKKLREGLHLEFFLSRGRLILTPHLSHLTTAEATPAEEAQVLAILDEKQDLLEQLKLYLLYDLSLHSALLETNSYDLAVNEHRLITRFLPYGPEACEVKLYTLPPGDPVLLYGDRIYLGRDCLRLDSPGRPHLGIDYMRQSLPEQLAKLRTRIAREGTPEGCVELESDFLEDLGALVEEFAQRADAVVRNYPPEISSRTLSAETLLEVSREFRDLKHVLCDAELVVRDLEEAMLGAGSHTARYVTKLRKDLANDVDYLMSKVNGRIVDSVNAVRL